MAESSSKADREAELDRKIAQIRQRNEALVKRQQEIDNDRFEASKVTGGTVSLSSNDEPTDDDNAKRMPVKDIRARLGKGRSQDSAPNSTADGTLRDTQQKIKSDSPDDDQWRQERERVDKERMQRAKASGGKWKREWDSAKANPNMPGQQSATSGEGGRGRRPQGPSGNASSSPAANHRANRPANQQRDRPPRQDSVPEDPKPALQRSIVADGDKITVSFPASKKPVNGSPENKSIKSRLGARVEPPETVGTKSKSARPNRSEQRAKESIKLHVLPIDKNDKADLEHNTTDSLNETTNQSEKSPDSTEQWEDVDEEENDSLFKDATNTLTDLDTEPNEAAVRNTRTDTFDRIQQEMIDKMNENVDAVEALMDESDDDIDAFLAGKRLVFSRRFDREQQSETDVAECVSEMVRRVSLE